MQKNSMDQTEVSRRYLKRSPQYDSIVRFFNLFSSFGFDIPAWREEAIRALKLKTGDTVVDIGCGTGLNFPLLQDAVGHRGKIIGVDLSDAMLEKAYQQVTENHWQNVELVCADAAQYTFPSGINGILSTFALVLVPGCDQVIVEGSRAIVPGGRISILDMAWPEGLSLRWRHMLFFLQSFGVSRGTLEKQPWKSVWKGMDENLEDVTLKRFWFGFMYLANGVRKIE